MADVASLMRVRADAKGLSLDIEFDGPIPETIHSDRTRLRQILINLVGNAIKFTKQGGARIITRFDAGSNGSAALEIDVVDTGIGMSEDQLYNLFLPLQ
jgi:signal transduction histidine kinase